MNGKIILFDFDGVIADTFEAAYETARDFHPGIKPDEYRKMFEGNIYDSLREKLKKINLNDHNDRWFKSYGPKVIRQKLIPGIKQAIFDLALDYTLVIISSTINAPIEEYIRHHELAPYFGQTLGADIHHSKSEKIQMIFKRYGVGPADCLFITDTLGDLREAARAGIKSIAVTWGFHNRKTLLLGKPMLIIDKPEELYQNIKFIF